MMIKTVVLLLTINITEVLMGMSLSPEAAGAISQEFDNKIIPEIRSVQPKNDTFSVTPDLGRQYHQAKTPLHWAVEKGDLRLVKLLIARGAPLDVRDCCGNTVFDRAVIKGHAEIVDFLLQYFSVHKSNLFATPLHCAAGYGHAEVARVLLKYGARVDAQDDGGRTPLHAAVAGYGNAGVVAVLLEHGAQVGARDADGSTSLDISNETGDPEIISLLESYR